MLLNDPFLGTKAKLKLLVHGIQDSESDFENEAEYKAEHYAYDNGNWGINHPVPSEILLPGNIVSKLHIRPYSPLRISRDADGCLYLFEGNNQVCPCEFLPPPNFWRYKTSSGIPTKRLAHLYGKDCLNFNIFSGCEFMKAGTPCLFCSVEHTQATYHSVEIKKHPMDLADVCRLAIKHDTVRYFLMTAGSTIERGKEFNNHMEVLAAVRDLLPWGGEIRGNVSLMPPDDIHLLVGLKDVGVTNPSFNLEVWPRKAFEYFCPGKSKYVGFEHILKSYEFLVELYGSGNLWCNFVAGLVPLDDIKAGFQEMAIRGVVPGANIYHPEVGSFLGNTISSPDENFIRELYLYASELYHQYDYQPFFDASVLRNSLANEAYMGWLQ